jgi:hypothetical protein
MLYWEVFVNEGLYRPRVVLTIHNLDNTGECRQEEFAFTGRGRGVTLDFKRREPQCVQHTAAGHFM